ncbi:MAG: hypothetical protein U5L74_10345 [Ideonella sp.]|nr:hypothetical protein [Ideonella sp.]
MPTLHLQLCPPQPPATLRALAQALTQISASVLLKRSAVTALHIQEAEPSHWALGGAVPEAPMALLEIRISQGSNSAEEKAAFVAQAYATLQAHLDAHTPLALASYVTVLEVPAQNWGYGGQTQAQRQANAQR